MTPGLVVLVVALAAATAFGLWRRHTDGRFTARRDASPAQAPAPPGADPVVEVRAPGADPVVEVRAPGADPVVEVRAPGADPVVEVRAPGADPVVEVRAPASLETTSTWSALSAVLPSAELGERATFVQFSSAFCAPCRTTRVLLADVADKEPGVSHVEVDAEEHLPLVRELDIRRTPTTLILDATGAEVARAAGAPRREQVLAALPQEAR